MKKLLALSVGILSIIATLGLTQSASAASISDTNRFNRVRDFNRNISDRNFRRDFVRRDFDNRVFNRNFDNRFFRRDLDNRRFRDFDSFRFRNINSFYSNRFFPSFNYFYPINTGYYFNTSFYPYTNYYTPYYPVNFYNLTSAYPYYSNLYNQYSFLQTGYTGNVTARQIVMIDRDNPTSNYVISNPNAGLYAFDRVIITLDNDTYTSMMSLLSGQNAYMTRVDVDSGTISIVTDNGTVIATGSGAIVIQ